MIYLIGGAPRAGKSILCQQFAAHKKIGWVSTDLLMHLLKADNDPGIKSGWNASSEAIATVADRFFPYLERFVWGVNSMAESYVIEGVDFLPAQVAQLSERCSIRSVFLGCSTISLEQFDQFPGHSRGYAALPLEMRQRIVQDLPLWSEFVRQEAERFGYPYVDMADDFPLRLQEANAVLAAGTACD